MTFPPLALYNGLMNCSSGVTAMEVIQEKSSSNIRGQVARILFERANGGNGQRCLAQRDIAEMLDTTWGRVHESLNSLFNEGAIVIEGNRIILKRDLILKAAGETL